MSDKLYIGVLTGVGECCPRAHVFARRFPKVKSRGEANVALHRFKDRLEARGFDLGDTLLLEVEVPIGRADLCTVREA